MELLVKNVINELLTLYFQLSAIDETPSFPVLKKILSNSDKLKLEDDAARLLYWVLAQGHEPVLKTVPKEKVVSIFFFNLFFFLLFWSFLSADKMFFFCF